MRASRSNSVPGLRRDPTIGGDRLKAVRRFLTWIADRPVAFVPLVLIAIAERLGWALAGHLASLDTELRNVAMHWARTGEIADAFRPGSGPTAHVGALPIVIPGAVYRLFGIDTPASNIMLTIFSALAIVATAFVLNRLFARLGVSSVARGAAVLTVCAIPLHIEIEARSLRVYENGYAALVVALLLLAIVRLESRPVRTVDLIGLSALAAFIVALSPTAGFCGIAVLGIFALRRLDRPRRARAAAMLGIILGVTILPWALRNEAVVGAPVVTRDNFGLEFAIGTHPAAVAPADPAATYLHRLAEIHPHGSDPAYRALEAAGGEVAYARRLGEATWAWVAAHPVDASTIWARHAYEFFLPPAWMWLHSGAPDVTTPFRIVAVDIIALLALAGLVIALARRNWMYLYLLPPVVLLPLPYLLSQPLIRYRYVIASLLIFLAADCVSRLTGGGQGGLKRRA